MSPFLTTERKAEVPELIIVQCPFHGTGVVCRIQFFNKLFILFATVFLE
jgi:hypothetical protein